MIAEPEVDIEQSSRRAVEEITLAGVALVELVTGLGVRVEPGAGGGARDRGRDRARDRGRESEEAESEREDHPVSHPLTARVPRSLSDSPTL